MQEKNTDSRPLAESAKHKVSRRTIVAGAAWATPVVMIASASPALAATSGTGMACRVNEYFTTKGGGKFLNGSLFNLNLDNLAEVYGIDVLNTPLSGSPNVTKEPATGPNPGFTERTDGVIDAWANPLNVSVLKALNVNLGGATQALGSILNIAETGVLNQYGLARENGLSRGFAGLVSNSGGVTLSDVQSAPAFGNINLKTVIANLAGTGLANLVAPLAALDLNIGAVGAAAEIDSCLTTQSRDYHIASANLTVGSDVLVNALDPVVGQGGAIDAVNTAVNGLTAEGGLLSDLVTNIISSLNVLNVGLARVKAGSANGTNVAVSIDLEPVRALLADPLTSDALALSLTDADKMLFLDLDALLGSLNGHPANTTLLPATSTIVGPVVSDIGTFLNQLPDTVLTALQTAVNNATVKLDLKVALQYNRGLFAPDWVDAGSVNILLDTTLGELIAGDATLSATFSSDVPVVGPLLRAIVNPLLAGLTLTLNGLLATAGTAINSLLLPLINNVGTLLEGVVDPVLTQLLDPLLTQLLVDGIINLIVNVQDGAYDVAALKLSVLPDGGIDVVLAKAYAGENIAV
ncbi:choice-of-anchor G family protein [Glutamicibacter arilaitensis]|uniref:choice-of-anchor G family protein n=1 Tax=Glutamicibacter arilaitensis TaxID=256701 RepID=UPI003FD45567